MFHFDRITIAELHKKWQQGQKDGNPIRIIDVRSPGEYEQVHIPGAELVPLNTLPTAFDELAGEADLYLLCHSGMRSMQAANYLAGRGVKRLFNVDGGIVAWLSAGFPSER